LPEVWIKICGLTRSEDAQNAAALGANALGVVIYPPSSRAISPDQLSDIFAGVGPETQRVALFVDPEEDLVNNVLASECIDLLQFHGNEDQDFCESFGLPYVKAIRVRNATQALEEIAAHPAAQKILLDKYVVHAPGGTGQTLDWDIAAKLVEVSAIPIVLAGGLNEKNVVAALKSVRPAGVDVSSGVEQRHGIKSIKKLKSFIQGVRSV
jgi:phosphoribosylanthranilate isomerase|tara:strand:+ start:854 stop:1483 length:630 start_codon:yes stop_codon:yes gene_type:complete